MDDWVKLLSFENLYEAEIKKALLDQAGIENVIINARDSLFLIGEIELWVRKQDKEKAENILLQFQGITKINSFILEKPVRLFQEFLKQKGIESTLKRKEETEFVLDNYELYVKNEDVEKVKPYLVAEQLDDWIVVEKCNRVRQTRFRVELLEEHGIDAMIVKKKDSNFHLEEIKIFVKQENKEKAEQLLKDLPNWTVVYETDKLEKAELFEDILGQNGIKGIIKKDEDKIKLFVEEKNKDKALLLINAKKEWKVVKVYESLIKANLDLDKLLENNINASVISKKDQVFLLGEYYLYVEDKDYDKALKILNE